MTKRTIFSLVIAAAFMTNAAIAAADTGEGEKLFKKKCGSCHKMDKNVVGPKLKGVVGRKAGSTDFPNYKALKDADFVWDEEKLSAWIANPKKFIGKRTAMVGKVRSAEDRKAIIAYLKSFQ
ncbi:c-type cytochrome [Varunaivibrio sulfuroxidans]|uniref:Cytochrome c n=1 Tax=Varunaivibrio sulfuroxidans TaxID=1773489 RepID=A0A4R3J8G9_9PROT|nr:c-type cytochrome [Varunaivibrio sulfuroxidans]TCS61782.1 cytochrome c [Varunaivibrio sulfuroxidans]WES32035.1 c-type cytochrome [Varunaivibrio sulfuroxidans]